MIYSTDEAFFSIENISSISCLKKS